MFPHMYKVRPGKIQQVKEPGMATDCQRQRDENWRRNSGGGSSFQQNPPAIPAPPPDPQDNLTRKPSLPSKEPARKGSQGHAEFIENVSLANRNSPSPILSRTRIRARGQPEANNENIERQENAYPPPGRRSRTRQSDGQLGSNENGETVCPDRSRMRTRSRSRISEDKSLNETSPASTTDAAETSSTIRLRSRSRQNEELKNDFPPQENSFPTSRRSRSRPSEDYHNNTNHNAEEESASFSPRLRTRSRTRPNDSNQSEMNNNVNNEDTIADDSQRSRVRMRSRSRPTEDISTFESSSPINIRTRSRSRTNRAEEDQTPAERSVSPKTVFKPQSLPPVGRQPREQVSYSDNNCEASETIPLRSRSRNRGTTELNNNQNNSNIEISETIPIRSRSRNRDTQDNDNEGNSKDSQIETLRSRSRRSSNKEESLSLDSDERKIISDNKNLSNESEKTFSQEEAKDNELTPTPPPSSSSDRKESSNRFFPETQKSEFIIRKRSLSPVPPSTTKDTSPVTRRRRPLDEELKHSPPPVDSKFHDESSPITRRRSQPSSAAENEQVIRKNIKQDHPQLEEERKEENDSNFKEETEEQEEQEKEEEEEEKDEIENHEETDEDQEEDDDPLAKATRLWLLSKNQNSEILDKVLPEIESTSAIKKKTSEEENEELIDPDLVIDKLKEPKPQMIEEWNDEFKEEPKNFTSFTSIKLKSRPPKSPPQKKSGKHLSKDGGSQIPTAPAPPPPPPPPPAPPKSKCGVPPPPPPPMSEKDLKVKKAREKMVDKIKRAARSRPDWKSVMKDIEGGTKLRKVSSSEKLDRSNPILPKSRGKGGKFFYESEKPVVQNQLLGEIQRGVKLRHVKTNDRSKPDFAKLGLRKLRRQLTVEEKKSLPPNAPEALPSSSDEEEDIDQMRDDLASTKTQLAEEIKKNKKLETEQKILQIDLQSLQAEVKKLKRKLKEAGIHEAKPLTNGEAEALAPKLSKSMSKLRMMEDELDFAELDTIEKDIQLLNDEIEAQKKRAEKAELKCEELNQKLEVSQASCDEWEMRSVYFEKKHKALQKDQGIELPEIDCSGTQTDPVEIGPAKSDSSTGLYAKKSSSRKSFASVSRMQSLNEEDESDEESSSSSEEDTLSDHQDDEDEERDSEEFEDDLKGSSADLEKREEREFITWKNRLTHMKDKVKNVRKERNNLRERVKKFYADMRNERKGYLKLKEELKELSDQMKDDEEDNEDDEEEEEESEEEEEEIAQEEESPDWWREEAPQKPKKLKKRKKKKKENEDEDENIVDMSGLEDPEWSDSEQEESESEEEDDNTANRIKSLKERTKDLEENMNAKRKETYLLKSRIDQCDEMFAEEKRRHARLENELHMLLADI